MHDERQSNSLTRLIARQVIDMSHTCSLKAQGPGG
jgi:hypothetical protein